MMIISVLLGWSKRVDHGTTGWMYPSHLAVAVLVIIGGSSRDMGLVTSA
jgi:hypothetical protein